MLADLKFKIIYTNGMLASGVASPLLTSVLFDVVLKLQEWSDLLTHLHVPLHYINILQNKFAHAVKIAIGFMYSTTSIIQTSFIQTLDYPD